MSDDPFNDMDEPNQDRVPSTYPDTFAEYYDEPTLEGIARQYAGTANTRNIEA